MARTQPTSIILQNHPPQSYYEVWAAKIGLDLQKFPFLKTDFDPSKGKILPFAVYDFDLARDDNGHQVAMALVRYKSLFSKSTFQVICYL